MEAEVREEIQLRELNAAVVSFYANAHQRGAGAFTSPLVRTLRLPDAADLVLRALKGGAATKRVAEVAERVRCFGIGSLATAALVPSQRVPHTDNTLRRLAGSDYGAVADYIRDHTEGGEAAPRVGHSGDPARAPMTRARLISSLLVGSVRGGGPSPQQADVGKGVQLDRGSLLPTPPGMTEGVQPLRWQPDVRLDPISMVTTVPAQGHYYGDLADMAPYLDPRSWATVSPEFWVASRRVRREGGRFVPLDVDGYDPPLGQSWSGLFEEKMVLCFEGGILSGYTNHLNIRFESHIDKVDPTKSRVWVGFSLYQCESSVQLMRFAPSGMDVDEGYAYYWQAREPVPEPIGVGGDADDLTVWCRCVKRVRYTDTLTRRTSGQGSVGAGEMMNYLAPGGLGLWLDYLIAAGPHAGMTQATQRQAGGAGARPAGTGAPR